MNCFIEHILGLTVRLALVFLSLFLITLSFFYPYFFTMSTRFGLITS